jgi:hypothetical protein
MNPDVFAEWLRRQGRKLIRTESSYWLESGPRIYQALPYHWLITPSADELSELFRAHGAIGLRYSTAWKVPQGAASYHVVFTDAEEQLSSLSKKARHDVYRGLEAANVESISFERLATEGWHLRTDTLERQGRLGAEKKEWWQNLCRCADSLPGFEAWAAVVNGHLAASLIAFTCDNCCSILYQQSCKDYLSLGVNNALTFAFTNEIVKRPGHPWIFYGLVSLDAPSSVDKFKFRMGYKAKPVRQQVVFDPRVAAFFNPVTHAVLFGLKHMWPRDPILAKTEGLVRFYLEGRKPLEQQNWPQALLKNE